MSTFKLMALIAVIVSTGFAIALNWATGLDYSSQYASMMPIGIAMVAGFITAGAWGGVLGAWLDYKAEEN